MSDASLDILMITHNRPTYTEMTLRRLLDTCDRSMRVWVWHNGEDRETLDVVLSFEGNPHLHKVHVSPENKRLREPTNWFWQRADAAYFSKVDDDCLLPMGWAEPLLQAHHQCPRLGMIGCWRFFDEDFVPELAKVKIRDLGGGHRIMLNCWVQGSGYVMKREVFQRIGGLGLTESFTDYGIRAARAGWTNGWYFPFIREDHMDDPRSSYSELRCNEDFLRHRPLSAVNDDVRTIEEWKERIRWMARSVQAAPPDPSYHVGWRRKLRGGVKRLKQLAGYREPWRARGTGIGR